MCCESRAEVRFDLSPLLQGQKEVNHLYKGPTTHLLFVLEAWDVEFSNFPL